MLFDRNILAVNVVFGLKIFYGLPSLGFKGFIRFLDMAKQDALFKRHLFDENYALHKNNVAPVPYLG